MDSPSFHAAIHTDAKESCRVRNTEARTVWERKQKAKLTGLPKEKVDINLSFLVVINVMYIYCVVPERSMPSLWRIISNFKRLGVLQLSCNFQKGGVQTKNPLYEEYGYFPEQHFFKYKQIETDSFNCRSAKKNTYQSKCKLKIEAASW